MFRPLLSNYFSKRGGKDFWEDFQFQPIIKRHNWGLISKVLPLRVYFFRKIPRSARVPDTLALRISRFGKALFRRSSETRQCIRLAHKHGSGTSPPRCFAGTFHGRGIQPSREIKKIWQINQMLFPVSPETYPGLARNPNFRFSNPVFIHGFETRKMKQLAVGTVWLARTKLLSRNPEILFSISVSFYTFQG